MLRHALLAAGFVVSLITVELFADEPSILVSHESPALRAAILKKLDAPVKFEPIADCTLVEAISTLVEQHKMTVVFNRDALDEEGIDPEKIPRSELREEWSGLPLKQVLKKLLKPNRLTWVIRNNGIVLTTPQHYRDIELRAYDVTDLLLPPVEFREATQALPDKDALLTIVMGTVAPTTWSDVGGQASARILPIQSRWVMLVNHASVCHDEIDLLLKSLRDCRQQQFDLDSKRVATHHPVPTIGPHPLLKKLDAPAHIEKVESLSLATWLRGLKPQLGIPIRIDERSLEGSGIPAYRHLEINGNYTGLDVRSVLDSVLKRYDLTWIICDDEVLVLTNAAADDIWQHGMTIAYPVWDLVRTVNASPENFGNEDYSELIQVITGTVAPTTWTDVGGQGAIKVFRNAGAIVLSQTQKVHEEIGLLLTALRIFRDKEAVGTPSMPATTTNPMTWDTRVYDVRDVLANGGSHERQSHQGGGYFQVNATSPSPNAVQPVPATQPAAAAGSTATTAQPTLSIEALDKKAKQLVELIPRYVAPESWMQNKGQGTIEAFGTKLIIKQTPRTHREILRFLRQL